MSHHSSIDKSVIDKIPDDLDGITILDVGCGYGVWNLLIRVKKRGIPIIIGLDIYLPYLQKLKKIKLYNGLVWADARYLPFRSDKPFNITLASEILEHLKKDEGMMVLNRLMHLSNKIIISTPYGFLRTFGVDNNKYQLHKSSWAPQDFHLKGLDTQIVYSIGLDKLLRKIDKIRNRIFKVPRREKRQIIAWSEY